jgi:hypothetical protein
MDRRYQCRRCFNAHIERKKSKCDYRFKKELSAAEIGTFKITSTAFNDGVLRIRYKLEIGLSH